MALANAENPEAKNAQLARMAYVTNPGVRSRWKEVPKIADSTVPIFLWETSIRFLDADGEVNG